MKNKRILTMASFLMIAAAAGCSKNTNQNIANNRAANQNLFTNIANAVKSTTPDFNSVNAPANSSVNSSANSATR